MKVLFFFPKWKVLLISALMNTQVKTLKCDIIQLSVKMILRPKSHVSYTSCEYKLQSQDSKIDPQIEQTHLKKKIDSMSIQFVQLELRSMNEKTLHT